MPRGKGEGGGNRGRGGRGGGGRGGRGGRGGGPRGTSIADELDFNIRIFADTPSGSAPRGRGRGGRGGQFSGPNSGSVTPSRGRGRGGYDSPRGRGRGQDFSTPRRGDYGIGASPRGRGRRGGYSKHATLSGLLYQERPLLRPIVFVPSVLTKVLFQEDEELIKPGVEEVDDTERSHIPTADQVSRVFSGGNAESSLDNEEEEEIEEVHFDDVGKLFDVSATTTTTTIRKSKLGGAAVVSEEQFTGFYVASTPAAPSTDVDDLAKMMEETLSAAEEPQNAPDVEMSTSDLFCVDVQPTPVPADMAPARDPIPSALRDDDDDDIIVYVAPHPRNTSTQKEETPRESTPAFEAPDTSLFTPYVSAAALPAAIASSSKEVPVTPSRQPFPAVSFAFAQKSETPGKPAARLQVPPLSTPRQAKAWRRKRGLASKKGRSIAKPSFGAFGAMREEAEMHRDDPRRSERRRGDSDLEWGDTDDDDINQADEMEEGLEELLSSWGGKAKQSPTQDKGKGKARAEDAKEGAESAHGMEVDDDLDLDAMKNFVGGLLGNKAGQHVTMDDLYDEGLMQLEDEEKSNESGDSQSNSSGDESVEDILATEEAMMISETLKFEESDDSEDSDDSDDDDQTPKTSFQARLERLREQSRSRKHLDNSIDSAEGMKNDSDEDEDDLLHKNMTWAENDEAFMQEIQDILDKNEDVLHGRDRKKINAVFHAIHNGHFEDEGLSPAKRRKDKGKDLPPDLQAIWEKDRKAKAEYKKAREQARLENAADPMAKKKGGKKGRKAMLAAARLDPTITVIPNRIIDMVTLVQQIRRFIADVGGPSTISLPPTNKETRKNIHEMAAAFNLKSVSNGKGDSRYTTLSKTTRSGFGVNEQKVAKIVRRSGGMGARGDSFINEKKGRGAPSTMPRHREGDEVGKAAPKLTQSNIGFRMLALMGWSEGDRIGITGASLDAPLAAIIKTTKLGLGATK